MRKFEESIAAVPWRKVEDGRTVNIISEGLVALLTTELGRLSELEGILLSSTSLSPYLTVNIDEV
jgi:TolB-like protein